MSRPVEAQAFGIDIGGTKIAAGLAEARVGAARGRTNNADDRHRNRNRRGNPGQRCRRRWSDRNGWESGSYARSVIFRSVVLMRCARPLEAFASGPAIEDAYQSRTGKRLSLRAIGALAADDNQCAQEVLSTAGTMVGRVLAGAANLIDPDVIVIGEE
jgi:predicted NBD/HSP70 family sugar kinase